MKIRVRNYQTSSDTALDVGGFTVIVGKSNTGKTGLLRAIEGALFNDPVTGKVRHGEDDAEVTITYKGIHWVWKKGANHNDYTVTTKDGTKEYSRVGFQAPDEIKEAGFREIVVDGNKTRPQVACWHDPVFLVNSGGKVVTELISAVTRLDVVNMAQRLCSKELRATKSTIKVRESDLVKARNNTAKYDALDSIPDRSIETLWTDFQSLESDLQIVTDFSERYERACDRISSLDGVGDITIPDTIDTQVCTAVSTVDGWISRLDSYETALSQLDSLDQVGLLDIDVIPTVNALNVVTNHYQQYDQVTQYIKKLMNLGNGIKQVTDELSTAEDELHAELDRLSELRGDMGECPVCGR